jgi:outer membrane lipoprotein carrier protein
MRVPFISYLFISFGLFAQKADRAVNILNKMSTEFANMKTMSASFTYNVEGDKKSVAQTYKGDFTVKGLKFKLKLAGQEIFGDGKELYTYVKETNEVNVQAFDATMRDKFNPTKIYSIYKKGYKYVFVEEVKEGSNFYEVVELSPEDKKSDIQKVQIRVNKADKSVKSWKIWHKNGKKETFKVDRFMANQTVDDKLFNFDKKKYPGVEVIDLR